MGPIVDRSRENLVPTDYGIVMTRNRLRKAATDLAEKGVMPTGREPEHMKVRSVAVVLEADEDYVGACKEVHLKPIPVRNGSRFKPKTCPLG